MDPLRILLVDDEPTILPLAKAMLEKAGHLVVPASSERQGLHYLYEYQHRIDVVIADSGALTVLREARDVLPPTRRYLMTGKPLADLPPLEDYGIQGVIEKPGIMAGFRKLKLIE